MMTDHKSPKHIWPFSTPSCKSVLSRLSQETPLTVKDASKLPCGALVTCGFKISDCNPVQGTSGATL